MFKYFLAENLKTKRTFLYRMTFIAPIMVAILSILLCVGSFQMEMYNWWYTAGITALLSIGSCLLVRVDSMKKNRAVLGLPVDLKKIWIAKVLVGVKNIAVSGLMIFACGAAAKVFVNFHQMYDVPLIDGFAGIIIMLLTTMWMVPLLMFMGRKIGMFPTILISFAVEIFSTIIAVKREWCFIPFCYVERLMCPVLKILPNGLRAVPESQTFTPELMNTDSIFLGIAVSIVLFVLFTFLTAKCFEKQEAR